MITGKDFTYTTIAQDTLEEGIKLVKEAEKKETNKTEIKNDKDIAYLKHKQYINKLVIIRNSISLICFTILAIVFKNIWIVLLAILFTASVSKED